MNEIKNLNDKLVSRARSAARTLSACPNRQSSKDNLNDSRETAPKSIDHPLPTAKSIELEVIIEGHS